MNMLQKRKNVTKAIIKNSVQVYENGSLDDKTVIYFNLHQALRGISKGPDRETVLMQRVRMSRSISLYTTVCISVRIILTSAFLFSACL